MPEPDLSQNWQCISSAPRDGSPVELTWFDGGEPAEIWTCQWAPLMANGLFPGKVGFWVTPDGSMTWGEHDPDGAPTHWRFPAANTTPAPDTEDLATVRRAPTPYGVEVDVYRVNVEGQEVDITPPEGMAILFGIYVAKERQRFVDNLAAEMPARDVTAFVQRYGGHHVPRVALEIPGQLAGNALSQVMRPQVAVLSEILHRRPSWAERAEVLLMQPEPLAPIWNENPALVGYSTSLVLAGALEGLGEEEVTCLEAAAFYALSSHAAWREAGRRWLSPFRSTWMRDWTAARPLYCRIARAIRKAHPDVPAWLCGVS